VIGGINNKIPERQAQGRITGRNGVHRRLSTNTDPPGIRSGRRESAAAPTSKMNPVTFPTLSGGLANDDVMEEEDLEAGGPRDGVCGERKTERDLERLARVTQLTNQVPDKGPLIGDAQAEQSSS
jgi:hypothetical protein